MQMDVSTEHLEIIRKILKKHVPEYKVLAFGSRVNGKAKKFSDLDLAILSEKPLALKRMALMREDFSESDLPYKIDLVDWSLISKEFKQLIQKESVEIL